MRRPLPTRTEHVRYAGLRFLAKGCRTLARRFRLPATRHAETCCRVNRAPGKTTRRSSGSGGTDPCAPVGVRTRSPARCPAGAGGGAVPRGPPRQWVPLRRAGIEARRRSRSSGRSWGLWIASFRGRHVTVATSRIRSHRPVGHSGARRSRLSLGRRSVRRGCWRLRRWPSGDAAASGRDGARPT